MRVSMRMLGGFVVLVLGVGWALGPGDILSVTTAETGGQQDGTRTRSAESQPAKDKDGGFTLKASAKLVLLDVIVRDAAGNVVTGLVKDDFRVMEAGQPQTVLNFEAAGAHVVRPEVTVRSTRELDRSAPESPVNILLLDEFNTPFGDMAQSRQYLMTYLKSQPERLELPTMLVAADMKKFKTISDYTQDRDALLKALAAYWPAAPWDGIEYDELSTHLSAAFVTLARVAEAVRGHKGHKNLIWVGNGFPPALRSAPDNTGKPYLLGASFNATYNEIQRTENMLLSARITLYYVIPNGVLFDTANPMLMMHEFSNMAKETGGKVYLYNDVNVGVGDYLSEGSKFYTLAYRPTTNSLKDQKYRKTVVTVNRPELTATTSAGYQPDAGKDLLGFDNPKKQMNFDLLAAEQSRIVYDAVLVTVARVDGQADSFLLHVDANGMDWKASGGAVAPHARAVVITSTFDSKGKELARQAKGVEVSAPERVASNGAMLNGLILPVKLAHDPRAVRVRFVVRLEDSGRVGTEDVLLRP